MKLCLVGYAFAGKKYQAAELQKKYGLETLSLGDLVEEAVKFFEANPNPIAASVVELDSKPAQDTINEESPEAEGAMDGEKAGEDGAKPDEPAVEGQD